MTIAEIELQLYNTDYESDDFKNIFNTLIHLYQNGDTSLFSEEELGIVFFANEKEKADYIKEKISSRFVKLLKELLHVNSKKVEKIRNTSNNDSAIDFKIENEDAESSEFYKRM